MAKQKFWEFKAKANSKDEADLYLYMQIASWGGGYSAHSAKSFKSELDALGNIKVLNVYMNCPGGDVFEGNSIFNMLQRKAKSINVNMFVDGMAASIGSIILMAGSHISMASNSMLMLHKASSYVYGNSDELKECIKLLDKIDENIKQVYLSRANGKLDKETLDQWLDSGDTWLTAQEAYDYGLCDEITGAKQLSAKYDPNILNNYKNVPEDLKKSFFNAENQENNYKTEEKPVMDEATKAMIARINAKKQDWNL